MSIVLAKHLIGVTLVLLNTPPHTIKVRVARSPSDSEGPTHATPSRRLMLEPAAFMLQPRDERSRHLDSRPPHSSGLRSWPMPHPLLSAGEIQAGSSLYYFYYMPRPLTLLIQLSGCGINLLRKVRPFIGRFLKASMVGFTLLSAVSRSYYFTNTICA